MRVLRWLIVAVGALLVSQVLATDFNDAVTGCASSCLPAEQQSRSAAPGASDTRYTISGSVVDEESGESVVGATVYVPADRIGTATNQYGFYSLTVNADSVTLIVSHVSYVPQVLHVRLDSDRRLDIRLVHGTTTLEEIEVIAESGASIVDETQMSVTRLPVATIRKIPALAGELDVLKTLQLLPGVQTGREATSGLYVRGGGPDQNLILLDGVPVYNPYHLFGFLSVFNGDAVKDITLIKGGFPARYADDCPP